MIAWSVLATCALAAAPGRTLRVCADPNNLPFSNQRQEGFENELAALLARELGATLVWVWRPQRRGFLRGLKEQACDLVMGLPRDSERAATTRPYYRSSYVFVQRKDRPRVSSLDDPRLRSLKIGVPLVGDDGFNPPPIHALARRQIIDNVVGYSVFGDYARPNPPAALIEAVRRGEVDVAIAWGPLAGYFALGGKPALVLTPVPPEEALDLPFSFEISLGVRKGDLALRQALDAVLVDRAREIRALLDRFGVPP